MKRFLRLTLLLILLINLPQTSATDITVNFTATIKETTCAISLAPLNGANLSGDSATENYLLDLPSLGVSDITNKSSLSEASFKILPRNCNNYVSSMSMTIGGQHSGFTDSLLVNTSAVPGASYVGVGFKRMNDDDSLRFKLDGATRINWTHDEMTNGLDLTTIIRQTTSSHQMVPGLVQVYGTFVFTYN